MKEGLTTAHALKEKRIVVVGGTSGFGLATAQAAAAEGARVVVVSGNKENVDRALAALPKGSEGYTANISDEKQVSELFRAIGAFDHLVFTAGETLTTGEMNTIDFEKAKTFFDTRFWGSLMAARYASAYMRPGGSIVLTTGIAGRRPWKGWTVVAGLTGAIESLTRALAIELAPIRVNAVCAGLVRTPLWNNIPAEQREAMYQQVAAQLPVGRIGEPEDLAQSFLYLMKQPFSTGQVIVADGGGVLV